MPGKRNPDRWWKLHWSAAVAWTLVVFAFGLNTATLAGWQNWGYRASVDVALAATGLTSYAVVDLVTLALGFAARRSREPSPS
jgi:hypothetical protein